MASNTEKGVHDKVEIKRNLIQVIHHLLGSYGVDTITLNSALDKALTEECNVFDNFQLRILDRTLGIIFVGESDLWIGHKTWSGSLIPVDVLVTAYAMWRNARNFARKQGVDSLTAATALVKATHVVVEDFEKGHSIANVQKYLFGIYRHEIARTTRDPGFERKTDRIPEPLQSDEGAFIDRLDEEMLYRELIEVMSPQGRIVALLRYQQGCSWAETAEFLGTSINAVQKALSAGIKEAAEFYMSDMSPLENVELKRFKKRREKPRQPRLKNGKSLFQ